MLGTTRNAIRAILTADPSLTPTARAAALAAIDGKSAPAATASGGGARILRRAQVAERFNVSTRAIDHWAKAGILQRVCLPGRAHGAGFRESDVAALIEGRNEKSADQQ